MLQAWTKGESGRLNSEVNERIQGVVNKSVGLYRKLI